MYTQRSRVAFTHFPWLFHTEGDTSVHGGLGIGSQKALTVLSLTPPLPTPPLPSPPFQRTQVSAVESGDKVPTTDDPGLVLSGDFGGERRRLELCVFCRNK